MNPETWASIVAAVATLAGGVWTAKNANRANHETVVVSTEPQQRERDLAAFSAITDRHDRDIARLETRALADKRTLESVLRYLKKTLAVLRAHEIEPPAPDPADAAELAGHGIP